MFMDGGDPFHLSDGCGDIDGMPASCAEINERLESGSVAQQYLIHSARGFTTPQVTPVSLGLGLFGTETPHLASNVDNEWKPGTPIFKMDWRNLMFSFQPGAGPGRTTGACGDMADIAQMEADQALSTLSAGAHAGAQSAAIRQEIDNAVLRFDEAFSERYVGRPARTTDDLLDLYRRGPVGRTIPSYYFGQTGFKTRYMESRRVYPEPGKGYYTEEIVDNDQTHHFATMLSAGVNGSQWSATAHNIGDNDGDIRLTNAAYAIGATLRSDPYKGLKNIGKTIRSKICDPATRGPNTLNGQPVNGGSN